MASSLGGHITGRRSSLVVLGLLAAALPAGGLPLVDQGGDLGWSSGYRASM